MVYQDSVAEKFLKAMEEGTAPWQRPWESSSFFINQRCNGA